jgi:hypothetical protein
MMDPIPTELSLDKMSGDQYRMLRRHLKPAEKPEGQEDKPPMTTAQWRAHLKKLRGG